jgi:hypothetical protein
MTVARTPSVWQLVADQIDPPASPMKQWLYDPVGWVDACVDFGDEGGLTPYQRDILAHLVPQKRVAARGPHGLGKTMEASLALLWFATTRDACGIDWKVATTASVWRQLERYLWPEVHKWAKKLRWDVLDREPFSEIRELQALNLKLNYGAAFAVASADPALIEGVHADHVLYIFDEAKVIPPGTFDAAEGAFSGAGSDTTAEAYALAQSTPGEPSGRFYEIHQRKAGTEDWWTRHVTLDETIAAGRVSREWAEQRAKQWGTDSAVYANKVLGEFHSSDEDSVIPLAWVEAAIERWREWDDAGRPGRTGPVVVGVDVADAGGDDTVLAPRFGRYVDELRRSHLEDTMQTTGRVKALIMSYGTGKAVVDAIGVGAGICPRLAEEGIDGVAFVASQGTDLVDRSGEFEFMNKRAAAWWSMRELLDPQYDEKIALPPDDLLIGDLTAPKWKVTSTGKIQIEAKDDIRKRIGRSTDSGDAVVQAFWRDDKPVMTAGHARDQRLSKGRRAR